MNRRRKELGYLAEFLAQFPVSKEVTRSVVKHAERPIISKAQWTELKQLWVEKQQAFQMKIAHTPRKALEKFKSQRVAMMGGVKSGTLVKFEDQHEIEKEFAARMQAAKAVEAELCRQARPIIEKVLIRFAEEADELAKRIADCERDEFAKYGVSPYSESALVNTIRAAAFNAIRRIPTRNTSFNFETVFDGILEPENDAK